MKLERLNLFQKLVLGCDLEEVTEPQVSPGKKRGHLLVLSIDSGLKGPTGGSEAHMGSVFQLCPLGHDPDEL